MIKKYYKQLEEVIAPYIQPRLILAVLVGLVAGQLSDFISIDNILLGVSGFLILLDIGMSVYKKDVDSIVGKVVSMILIALFARGLPFGDPTLATVGAVLFYNSKNIYESVKAILKEVKQ